jgi:hypothetical protein
VRNYIHLIFFKKLKNYKKHPVITIRWNHLSLMREWGNGDGSEEGVDPFSDPSPYQKLLHLETIHLMSNIINKIY